MSDTATPTTVTVDGPVQTDADQLNVGSGADYRDGADWCNLDIDPAFEPDVVHDLDDRWPFPADSFELVLASHVFEHCSDLGFQMSEAARVLTPGGTLVWTYPIGREAKTDPTHEHYLTTDSCLWYAQNWEAHARGSGYQVAPTHPFTLEDRDVEKWVHLPESWRRPIPGWGGEVTAIYRRLGSGPRE